MSDLYRELAPISAAGWREIDDEARKTLKTMLAARRVVDFAGPKGFDLSAVGTGRLVQTSPPSPGVEARLREVLALVELRVPFEVRRSEIDAIDRGARDADLDAVIAASRKIAIAEDGAIFHGYSQAGIRGICEGSADAALTISDDYGSYPATVSAALNKLRDDGVDGPYAVVLSEQCYAGLTETTNAGYPVLEHVRRIIQGPIVWAPGLSGAVVVSLRGGDFELVSGRDFSIGYLAHDTETVRLYLEESFTFRLLSPQAAVPLTFRTAA